MPPQGYNTELNGRNHNKAMTIIARHLLRKIYGWYRSGEAFDEQRFFTFRSKYENLAKAA
jgi:hypothetical protein